jgi:hypothetical protein
MDQRRDHKEIRKYLETNENKMTMYPNVGNTKILKAYSLLSRIWGGGSFSPVILN